jgi:hypothetical protein
VVSYADLGGLGAREGTPVIHTWEPPPPAPPVVYVAATNNIEDLPWLLMLLPLFLLRRNRCCAAWWVWLPALISAWAGITITSLTTGNERSLTQAAGAFVVGLAALWLLMPSPGSHYRIVAFFKALLTLAGFSLLAFAPTLAAAIGGWLDFRPYLTAMLALGSLVVTLALTFGGLCARRRFGRIRYLLWLAVWTVPAWMVALTPFVVIGYVNDQIEWGASALALLAISGFTLLLLLPFVLLSFFQPLYRARFLDWLKVPEADRSAGATAPPKIPGVPRPEGTTTAP